MKLKPLAARLLKAFSERESPGKKEYEQVLVQKGYMTTEEIVRLQSGSHAASTLCGKRIEITDSFWHLHSLKEIFAEQVYHFESATENPYILDCGANIGLSVIYFKRLYPKARIIAFEPDASIFQKMSRNLTAFRFNDVVMANEAVWRDDGVLSFSAAGSLGGRVIGSNGAVHHDCGSMVSVKATSLGKYLGERVQFLKMDIEGAEVEVLDSCAPLLKNVENLFVEYHSDPEKEQRLDHLLSILKGAGFRIYLKEAWNNLPLPFMRRRYKPCYDLQLNVFAYRT